MTRKNARIPVRTTAVFVGNDSKASPVTFFVFDVLVLRMYDGLPGAATFGLFNVLIDLRLAFSA